MAAVAVRRGQGRVVHEDAQRPGGRVLVGEPDEEQLLEPLGLRGRLDVRELPADGAEQAVEAGLAQRVADGLRA